jgi:anaerobic selenocysteine-containing dehydrogenase
MENKVITTCAIDCPDNCGMIAKIKNGRLVRLEGNAEHGFTKGFLCKKGYRYIDRVYSNKRILFPHKKVKSGWQRINWDEALDTIAEKIRYFQETYGSGSIMHFWRTSSWGATKHLVRRVFNLLGGVTVTKGSLCSGSLMAAQNKDMGARLPHDPEDLLNSRVILIWGRDPAKTNIHLVPILVKARRQGARLVLIDPTRTKTALICDEHIAPRPGSDGYLAMGIAKEVLRMGLVDSGFIKNHTVGFDEYVSLLDSFSMEKIVEKCDVKLQVIRGLAQTYSRQKPSSILLGFGLNKWVHSPEMIRLIDALAAITGNLGIEGGGVNEAFNTKRHFDPHILAEDSIKFRREIPEPLLGEGIISSEDPPIKMAWINGTNPVISCPNSNKVIRALEGLDFLVVVDHFMTDTADLAHIFLPSTTFLEEEDIVVSWGHNWIGPVNKVIEPLGKSKSDLQIAQELSKRLGLEKEMEGTPREWLKRIFQPMEKAGLSVAQVMSSPAKCPINPKVGFKDKKFLTPSGKFEFISKFYRERENKFPYYLLTTLGHQWINSLILEDEHPEIPQVSIHPNLARKQGIFEQSRVLLKTVAGELIAEARLSDSVREDTLVISQGTWIKKGGGVNQLTEDLISTFGNMAAYHSTTVSIEAIHTP